MHATMSASANAAMSASSADSGQMVPLLELREVSLWRDGCALLRGVSLTLFAGERVVLLGANGAGKTCLLSVAHALMNASGGAVLWRGLEPKREQRHEQALVPQESVLLRRSAEANIRHGLLPLKLSGREVKERTAAALAQVGLTGRAQTRAQVLSGGEKQRLVLARALARKPALLLLDEPTARLDPSHTQAMELAIGQAADQGTAIFFVTHDPVQARALAQRVLFLHAGRLLADLPAEQFFAQASQSALPREAYQYLKSRSLTMD